MDPIEDIFSAMHLQSALYARIAIKAPWGINFKADIPARFGMVVSGKCWITSNALSEPLELASGDCFIINTQMAFSLQDSLDSACLPCEQVFPTTGSDVRAYQAEDSVSDIIIGRFIFDDTGGAPLMSILPPVMRIVQANFPTPLLQSTLQMLERETSRKDLGSRSVITRLADILFIQAVREWCSTQKGVHTGWLAAWTNPKLNPVQRAIHTDLSYSWSVAELAGIANMSRSAFAHYFKTVVGYTPLDYLTYWRMWRARCLLRQPALTLQQIAEKVGYETAQAFSRVFKIWTHITPGQYRQLYSIIHEPDS